MGIGYKDGISPKPLKEIKNDKPKDINWDFILDEVYRVLKPHKMCYMFGRTDMFMRISKHINDSKLKYCHDFIWRKGDMNYGNLNIFGNIHEIIIGLSKGSPEKSRKILIDNKIKKRTKAEYCGKTTTKEYYGHPMQKPVGLLSYIILNRTDENDVVFDPFCGVSSTLIASKILNRKYIGYEIDEEFYNLSIKRLNDFEHLKQFDHIKNKNIQNININGLSFSL